MPGMLCVGEINHAAGGLSIVMLLVMLSRHVCQLDYQLLPTTSGSGSRPRADDLYWSSGQSPL